MQKPLRSGELARLAGVSSDTLRYYERNRLLPLPPRASNGYRCYPPESLARVQLIRRALGLGFSIDELRRVLKARDSGNAPCKMVRELGAQKLKALDLQLQELTRFREELSAVLRDWDARLRSQRDGSPARLLESTDLPTRKRQFPTRKPQMKFFT